MAATSEPVTLPDSAAAVTDTPADEIPVEMPLPADPLLVIQLGLLILATLAAMYIASEVVLPVVLAFVLKLLLQPAMRLLERVHLPRSIAALLLLFMFFGTIIGLGAALSGPGGAWLQRLPEGIPRLEERLGFLREPINIMRSFLHHAETLTQVDMPAEVASPAAKTSTVAPPIVAAPVVAAPVGSPPVASSPVVSSKAVPAVKPAPAASSATTPAAAPAAVVPAVVAVPAEGGSLSHQIFIGTWTFAAGFSTTILLLFFLLISGDTFLRRLVEILPTFSNKRQAVDISQQIERDISIYLVTITVMNGAVGVLTGLVMWMTGAGDPVLWGAVAFLLNYIPILGPLIGIALFLLVGLLTIDELWQALLPAGCFLLIHLMEGQIVTPLLLAKRFTLNPVLVVVTLVFWFWMWGVPGAILSVPMLAIAKIICDRIRPLAALGHFLEG
ncbi:MAG: AI-2E family transporter [Dongiaceae bacterium]